MNAPRDNADRLLFLFSRSLDEDLTPEEAAELQSALADDTALASEAEGLRSLSSLIDRWGSIKVQTPGSPFVDRVLSRIKGNESTADEPSLDGLLQEWAAAGPPDVNGDSFRRAVLGRIGHQERRRGVVFRLGAVGAMAAMLAMAVFVWSGERKPRTHAVVTYMAGDEVDLADTGVHGRSDRGRSDRDVVVYDHRASGGSLGIDKGHPVILISTPAGDGYEAPPL